MSSPNINNVILLGCVLTYCTVFMNTTATDTATLCKVGSIQNVTFRRYCVISVNIIKGSIHTA